MQYLAIAIVVIQIWWGLAHLYAYLQVRKPLLLVPVAQAVVLGSLFAMIALTLTSGQSPVGRLSGLMLVVFLALFILWRSKQGVNILLEHYPNAVIDVLLFHKPEIPQDRSR